MSKHKLLASSTLISMLMSSTCFADTSETRSGLATFSNNCGSNTHYFSIIDSNDSFFMISIPPKSKITVLVERGSKYSGMCNSASGMEKSEHHYINLQPVTTASKEEDDKSEFSCSHPDVVSTVIKLAKAQDNKDFEKVNLFDIASSHFNLYTIVTTGHKENTTFCSAKLNVNYELSKQLAEIAKNDPQSFRSMLSNNFRGIDQNKEQSIRYYTQRSDDGQVIVTVNWR